MEHYICQRKASFGDMRDPPCRQQGASLASVVISNDARISHLGSPVCYWASHETDAIRCSLFFSFLTEPHHKLTVESISWLMLNRLAIVQSQPIQHLDSVAVEVAHATHQRCCLFRQLCQGLVCFFSVVLLHRQKAGSQLLNVSLHKGRG